MFSWYTFIFYAPKSLVLGLASRGTKFRLEYTSGIYFLLCFEGTYNIVLLGCHRDSDYHLLYGLSCQNVPVDIKMVTQLTNMPQRSS